MSGRIRLSWPLKRNWIWIRFIGINSGSARGKVPSMAYCRSASQQDTGRKKGVICVMMCIDVKNTFNTLRWEVILKEAKHSSLSYKLTRVLANYLKDWVVVLDNPSGLIKRKIFAGVSQVSVVGPLLWNLVYDGLLARFGNRINLRVRIRVYR